MEQLAKDMAERDEEAQEKSEEENENGLQLLF